MDLDNMIFPTGSTFIFGSWICEADNYDKLQGHLLEDPRKHYMVLLKKALERRLFLLGKT